MIHVQKKWEIGTHLMALLPSLPREWLQEALWRSEAQILEPENLISNSDSAINWLAFLRKLYDLSYNYIIHVKCLTECLVRRKRSIIVTVVFVTIIVKRRAITLLWIRWMKQLSKDTWRTVLKQLVGRGNHDDDDNNYLPELDWEPS